MLVPKIVWLFLLSVLVCVWTCVGCKIYFFFILFLREFFFKTEGREGNLRVVCFFRYGIGYLAARSVVLGWNEMIEAFSSSLHSYLNEN